MSVTPSKPPCFLGITKDVVEYSVAPFLDGEDCLALSLTCKESLAMDKMWTTLAQKWQSKAAAYFRHNHPLTATLDECFSKQRKITYLILDYADEPSKSKLGQKMICRLGVHAQLFENFPPEFLIQTLGSVSAYFQLPKMAPPKPPIEEFPELCGQLLDKACDYVEDLIQRNPQHFDPIPVSQVAEKQFSESMQMCKFSIFPSQLIDREGNRHAIMKGKKGIKDSTESAYKEPIIAVNTYDNGTYRVYFFQTHPFKQRVITGYKPVQMSNSKKLSTYSTCRFSFHGENRSFTGRSFDVSADNEVDFFKNILTQIGSSTSRLLKNGITDSTSSTHTVCVYEPFVPKTREESKEGKKA